MTPSTPENFWLVDWIRHHHGQRDAAVCTENSIRFDT